MTVAVLIKEQYGDIQEINIDLDPNKYEVFLTLGGSATFVGQWESIDVVVMKSVTHEILNKNKLPKPFDTEEIYGPILLIRMDAQSEPQDFTLNEYLSWV